MEKQSQWLPLFPPRKYAFEVKEVLVITLYSLCSTLIPSLAAESYGTQVVSKNSNQSGVIAGAVVGSVVGAALIVGGLVMLRKKYKKDERRRRHQSELDDEDFYADPFNPPVGNNNTASGPPATPRHNYVGQPNHQNFSDEYDEYGHISNGSVWSRISQRFPSLRHWLNIDNFFLLYFTLKYVFLFYGNHPETKIGISAHLLAYMFFFHEWMWMLKKENRSWLSIIRALGTNKYTNIGYLTFPVDTRNTLQHLKTYL